MKVRLFYLLLLSASIFAIVFSTEIRADSDPVSRPSTTQDEKRISAVATTNPTTVEIAVQKTQQEILSALGEDGTVRLSLRGVTQRKDGVADGLLVFVNKPDANIDTPSTDQHFVGAAAFAPTGSDKPQSFAFNISDSLNRLNADGKLDLSKPLKITIVATVIGGKINPAHPIEVSIHELSLTVPNSKP